MPRRQEGRNARCNLDARRGGAGHLALDFKQLMLEDRAFGLGGVDQCEERRCSPHVRSCTVLVVGDDLEGHLVVSVRPGELEESAELWVAASHEREDFELPDFERRYVEVGLVAFDLLCRELLAHLAGRPRLPERLEVLVARAFVFAAIGVFGARRCCAGLVELDISFVCIARCGGRLAFASVLTVVVACAHQAQGVNWDAVEVEDCGAQMRNEAREEAQLVGHLRCCCGEQDHRICRRGLWVSLGDACAVLDGSECGGPQGAQQCLGVA